MLIRIQFMLLAALAVAICGPARADEKVSVLAQFEAKLFRSRDGAILNYTRIPICGGGNTKVASRLTHIPIWAFHGDKDGTVPVDLSRDMIAAIKKAGGSPLYTEYKGVGHHCWAQTYANPKVLKWFFDQRRQSGKEMFVHQRMPSFHEQVDANGDGTVSLEELKAHAYFANNPKKAEEMFKQMDADKSGGLTEQEMSSGKRARDSRSGVGDIPRNANQFVGQ